MKGGSGTAGGSPERAISYTPISPSSTDGVLLSSTPGDNNNVNQQVAYLKNKLEEEHANYKRKLQAYQDGQQRQAQLIQKLQQKVLQYKRKCGELENSMTEKTSAEEHARKEVRI